MYNHPFALSKRITPFLALLLTLLPIMAFWVCWAHLAVNVPKWDDHALKAYLFYSEQETTFTGKIYQLFRQHNEHRIILDRFVTWLDFTVFGKLNYLHLMILGNASLLGLLGIFWAVLARVNEMSSSKKITSLHYLPPIAFLLFNLSSWENAFWGMAALQNFSVVLFVIGSIYVLSFTKNLPGAVILAVLATFASGNGILIWPIGAVLLALQRRFRPLVFWGISATIIIGLYFVGYEKPTGNPPAQGSIIDLMKGWLAFVGAAGEVFPVGNAFTVCLVSGGLLMVGGFIGAVWILFSPRINSGATDRKENYFQAGRMVSPPLSLSFAPEFIRGNLFLFFLGSVAFLLGTAAVVAWSRVGFGLDLLITSRYKIYSLTLLCIAYVFAITQLRGRWRQLTGVMGLVGSVAIAGLSYLTYADEVLWWRRWLLTNQYNWTYLSNSPVSGIDPTTARWVDNAPAYYDHCLSAIYQESNSDKLFPIDTVYQAGGQFIVKGTDERIASMPLPSLLIPDAGLTVLLQSDKRTYLYGALPNPANNALTALRRGIFPAKDMLATVPAYSINNEPVPGTYRLAVLQYDFWRNECVVYATNRTLTVKPGTDPTQLKKNW